MKANGRITKFIACLLFALPFTAPAQSQSGVDTFNAQVNGHVETLAIQSDGKILLSGGFTAVAGFGRLGLARLNADGTTDTNFVPNGNVFGRRLIVQPDGQILIGGILDLPGSEPTRFLSRFETNGVRDASYNPPLPDMPFALALQADGKVLAGYQLPPYLLRFHVDGSLDTNFLARPDYVVYDLAVQPDGKIVVAGYFEKMNGQTRRLLARLNADGSLDTGFDAKVGNLGYNWGVVRKVNLQADGKILFGGGFTSVHGETRMNIARLNSDGTLDRQFTAGTDGEVHALALQSNNRIVVAGDFTKINGQARVRLGRVNWDGSLDSTLTAGADRFIRTAALQPDGRIVVGGSFTTLGGTNRFCLGRLVADQNPAPVFIDAYSLRMSGGVLGFSFLNPNAGEFVVVASTNVAAPLASWENLGAPASVGGGLFEFNDISATNHSRRFYRLRTP